MRLKEAFTYSRSTGYFCSVAALPTTANKEKAPAARPGRGWDSRVTGVGAILTTSFIGALQRGHARVPSLFAKSDTNAFHVAHPNKRFRAIVIFGIGVNCAQGRRRLCPSPPPSRHR
jgi:hypothetical protein